MTLNALLNAAEHLIQQIINTEGDISQTVAEAITLFQTFDSLFASSLNDLSFEEAQQLQSTIDTLLIELQIEHSKVFNELSNSANQKKIQKNYV